MSDGRASTEATELSLRGRGIREDVLADTPERAAKWECPRRPTTKRSASTLAAMSRSISAGPPSLTETFNATPALAERPTPSGRGGARERAERAAHGTQRPHLPSSLSKTKPARRRGTAVKRVLRPIAAPTMRQPPWIPEAVEPDDEHAPRGDRPRHPAGRGGWAFHVAGDPSTSVVATETYPDHASTIQPVGRRGLRP